MWPGGGGRQALCGVVVVVVVVVVPPRLSGMAAAAAATRASGSRHPTAMRGISRHAPLLPLLGAKQSRRAWGPPSRYPGKNHCTTACEVAWYTTEHRGADGQPRILVSVNLPPPPEYLCRCRWWAPSSISFQRLSLFFLSTRHRCFTLQAHTASRFLFPVEFAPLLACVGCVERLPPPRAGVSYAAMVCHQSVLGIRNGILIPVSGLVVYSTSWHLDREGSTRLRTCQPAQVFFA